MGKTTIAHLLAQMAGYTTLEINASEDRSIKTLPQKIKSVISIKSVNDDKPKCLIIDEIDGIVNSESSNSLDFLVKLSLNKKGKTQEDVMQRPIICICNDLYAPSLRGLRRVSKIFRFQSFDSNLLVQRLERICKLESLDIERQALMELCKWNANDIRSCLNTLQFANTANLMMMNDPSFLKESDLMDENQDFQKKKKINSLMLKKISMGHKDLQSSLFQIWELVFTENSFKPEKNKNLKKKDALDMIEEKEKKKKKPITRLQSISSSLDPLEFYGENTEEIFENKQSFDFSKLSNLVNYHSERNLITDGCFENYLSIKTFLSDKVMLEKISETADWFEFYDSINNKVNSEDLGHYCSSVIASVHLNVASHMKPNSLKFPTQIFKVNSETTSSRNLLRNFTFGMNPISISSFSFSYQSVLLDLISLLLKVISPSPSQLVSLSENQKSILDSLAQTYFHFGLSFEQKKEERTFEKNKKKVVETLDSDNYYLNPPIHNLVAFPSLETTQNNEFHRFGVNLSYPIKQQLHLAIRSLRWQNQTKKSNAISNSQAKETLPKSPKPNTIFGSLPTPVIPTRNSPSPQKKDFFGRIIEESPKKKQTTATTKKASLILFKYAEGFANAVKRPVKLSYFL